MVCSDQSAISLTLVDLAIAENVARPPLGNYEMSARRADLLFHNIFVQMIQHLLATVTVYPAQFE